VGGAGQPSNQLPSKKTHHIRPIRGCAVTTPVSNTGHLPDMFEILLARHRHDGHVLKIGSGLPSNRPPTRCLDPCHQGHRQRAGRLKLQNWPNLSCAAHYHHHLLHLLSASKAVGCSRLPIVYSLQSHASIITHTPIFHMLSTIQEG